MLLCRRAVEVDQNRINWHFGSSRWARKSPGSGIHPLETPQPMLLMVSVLTWEPWVFLQSPSALQRDSSVWGIWGQEGPRLEVGSPAASQCCQHVPVLSHSLACLLLVFIYLPWSCRPRAGWLCRTPLVAWWLLPALSKSCSAGRVSPTARGERIMFLWEQNHHELPSEVCLALGNEGSSIG